MAHAVEQDVAADPADVGFLCARAVVAEPYLGPDAVEQPRRSGMLRTRL